MSRVIPEDVITKSDTLGRDRGISGALHPLDFMFWFIYDSISNKLDAPILYADSGKQVVEFLRDLLDEDVTKSALARRSNAKAPVSILEFASGYGRASRHFANELPHTDLVACDVHEEAVTFLHSIGIEARLSSPIPEKLDIGQHFDVVFALSFFTHMPRSTWARWLRVLADQLEPNGLLIFTAHGEVSQGLMGVKALEQDGFYYGPWSEQKDLPLSDYGGTVTAFDFVYTQVVDCELTLLLYKQVAIAHHDVYVLQRRRDGGYRPLRAQNDPKLALENQRLAADGDALRASRSWQITAPLRALSRAFKRH